MDATKTVINSLPSGIAALGETGNRVLREAITNNLVTFPSQVPIFKKMTRPDLQAKIAILYFVRGWSMNEIAERYNLARQRVEQIITQWRIRAVAEGYIQVTRHQQSTASGTGAKEYQFSDIPNDRKAFIVELETPLDDLLTAIEQGMLLDFSGYYGLAFLWKLGRVYRGLLLHDQKLTEDQVFETAKEAIDWLQDVIPRLD